MTQKTRRTKATEPAAAAPLPDLNAELEARADEILRRHGIRDPELLPWIGKVPAIARLLVNQDRTRQEVEHALLTILYLIGPLLGLHGQDQKLLFHHGRWTIETLRSADGGNSGAWETLDLEAALHSGLPHILPGQSMSERHAIARRAEEERFKKLVPPLVSDSKQQRERDAAHLGLILDLSMPADSEERELRVESAWREAAKDFGISTKKPGWKRQLGFLRSRRTIDSTLARRFMRERDSDTNYMYLEDYADRLGLAPTGLLLAVQQTSIWKRTGRGPENRHQAGPEVISH